MPTTANRTKPPRLAALVISGALLAAVVMDARDAAALPLKSEPVAHVDASGGLVRIHAPHGRVTMPALATAVAKDQRIRTGTRPKVRCQRAPAPGYGARSWCTIVGSIDGGSFVRSWEDGSWRFVA